MEPAKATEASDLVIHIISELVIHDYLEDGVWECLRSLQQKHLMGNSLIHHFVLTAEIEDELVGTIEIRENNHISLFCVEKEYRRRGIGRILLRRALEICVKNNPGLSEVTVNSLPGTVHIYERLGFHQESPEWMKGYTSYTPMHLDVSKVNMVQTIHNRSHH
jgi:GNAT superfamily N-acetyltransferase